MTVAQIPGQVVLIGAGPGDPDLLTCKAFKMLQRADVVVHDRLVSEQILALIPGSIPLIDVGKSPDHHPVTQPEINSMLVDLARSNRLVVRLKGGDPYMFARGSEEAETLRAADVPVSAVPGVSAAQGIAAATGAPLTHRGLATSVRFVTGHCRKGQTLDLDWRGLADSDTTLVFYMGRGHAAEISRSLIMHGMDPMMPAMLVADGTRPTQVTRFTRLATLSSAADTMPIKAPVLMMIGRVVTLAPNWQGEVHAQLDEVPLERVGHG